MTGEESYWNKNRLLGVQSRKWAPEEKEYDST